MPRGMTLPNSTFGRVNDARYNYGGRPVSGMPAHSRIGPAARYDPNAGTGAISGLASAYQGQYDEARGANEARYQDILGQYGGLYGRTMGSLAQRSEQGLADIGTQFQGARSRVGQNLTSSGLYGTSIKSAMDIGLAGEESAARNRFQDTQLREQRTADIGLTQGRLGFMERRTDEYPNQGALMQLAQMLGQAGSGGLSPEIMQLLSTAIAPGGGGGATTAGRGGDAGRLTPPRRLPPGVVDRGPPTVGGPDRRYGGVPSINYGRR